MATVTGPPGGAPPLHASSNASPTSKSSPSSPPNNATSDHVAECSYEFLLSEILLWVERTEKVDAEKAKELREAAESHGVIGKKKLYGDGENAAANAAIMAAERSAARIERMGYDVGYRLCERLAQHRPLLGPGSPSPEVAAVDVPPPIVEDRSKQIVDTGPFVIGGGMQHTHMDAKTQLEAVKFLCKEFWTEVFRKQIDKLQTNHRGVFVLKDLELKWLRRLPSDEENARVGAIRILAFPCGLIRGALACLGLSGAIVSCDFLADGKTMASCSFNIKVK